MLIDSNIIIPASKLTHVELLQYLKVHEQELYTSIVTKIEVLGYHQLKQVEKEFLINFFNAIPVLQLRCRCCRKSHPTPPTKTHFAWRFYSRRYRTRPWLDAFHGQHQRLYGHQGIENALRERGAGRDVQVVFGIVFLFVGLLLWACVTDSQADTWAQTILMRLRPDKSILLDW